MNIEELFFEFHMADGTSKVTEISTVVELIETYGEKFENLLRFSFAFRVNDRPYSSNRRNMERFILVATLAKAFPSLNEKGVKMLSGSTPTNDFNIKVNGYGLPVNNIEFSDRTIDFNKDDIEDLEKIIVELSKLLTDEFNAYETREFLGIDIAIQPEFVDLHIKKI